MICSVVILAEKKMIITKIDLSYLKPMRANWATDDVFSNERWRSISLAGKFGVRR